MLSPVAVAFAASDRLQSFATDGHLIVNYRFVLAAAVPDAPQLTLSIVRLLLGADICTIPVNLCFVKPWVDFWPALSPGTWIRA